MGTTGGAWGAIKFRHLDFVLSCTEVVGLSSKSCVYIYDLAYLPLQLAGEILLQKFRFLFILVYHIFYLFVVLYLRSVSRIVTILSFFWLYTASLCCFYRCVGRHPDAVANLKSG